MTELQNIKSNYTREDLVACGIGELFGPDRAKLPKDNMLMVDRITDINSDGGQLARDRLLQNWTFGRTFGFLTVILKGIPLCRGAWVLMHCGSYAGFFLPGQAAQEKAGRWVREA